MQPIVCDSACTVTLVITPAIADVQQYDAVLSLFGVALAALAFVWAVRRILHLFTSNHDA